MEKTTKTFRIFVSSTFSDLKEERNALQKQVFPELRKLSEQYGCKFQAIDLRWGVREEAALDQQTMKICLDEINRCQEITPRPNFIILLGDRYGWKALPAEIPADEFEKIIGKVTESSDKELLEKWYKRDDNAIPSVYCLQPRKIEAKEDATDEEREKARIKEAEAWSEIESSVQKILLSAISGVSLTDEQRLKYQSSATEQEITAGAMNVPNAQEHVFCFFREIKNLPHNESAKDFIDIDESGNVDEGAQSRLNSLKDSLTQKLSGNVFDDYEAGWKGGEYLFSWDNVPGEESEALIKFFVKKLQIGWAEGAEIKKSKDGKIIAVSKGDETLSLKLYVEEGRVALELNSEEKQDFIIKDEDKKLRIYEHFTTTDHLDKLCKDVYESLSRIIQKEVGRIKISPPLDKEIDEHIAFRKDRAKFFTGRAEMLKTIADYIKGDDSLPLAVWGDPGTGKSALLAKAVELARKDHFSAEIVFRFIGATPGSSDSRMLLESLCRQVSRYYEAEESGIPTDYKELVEEFPKRLALATAESPLILFLDALDQLSDANNARSLTWLPSDLPEHVRLVVSTLPGQCKDALDKKLPQEKIVKLELMPPEEGEELLNLWLESVERTLQENQREEVLGKFKDEGRPLYLKLAFEEARRWKSYTKDIELSPDISGIIRDLFSRLSSDANHGEMMVSRSLGFIAAAKNGLSEDELLDVLSQDEEMFENFMKRAFHKPPEKRLPFIVWSRLYFDLEPYLTKKSADGASLLAFYHPTTIGREVKENYLAGKAKLERHSVLANYFGSQKLFIEKDDQKTPNLRRLSELPFQQTYAKLWEALYETLTDFEFLEAKCTHMAVTTTGEGEKTRKIYGGVYELLEDYRRSLENFPSSEDAEG